MKRSQLVTGFVLVALGIGLGGQGCAPVEEDVDSTAGAATLNVSEAKVLICGQEVEGCPQCLPQMAFEGNGPPRQLQQPELNACTLKDLRASLQARINVLVSRAGERGFFLPAGGTTGGAAPTPGTLSGTPFKLTKINVIQAQGARYDYTKLSGIFSTGDPNAPPPTADCKGSTTGACASASMNVYSYYVPVKFVFDFQDWFDRAATPTADIRELHIAMGREYGLIPFFSMSGTGAMNLNIGSILSKFPGGGVGSALLAALGGQASIQVSAEKGMSWTSPVCSDFGRGQQPGGVKSDPKTPVLEAFDQDFYRNVLTPACLWVKKARPTLNLNCTGMESLTNNTIAEADAYMLDRKVLPVQSCSVLDAKTWSLDSPRFRVAFVAPKAWGYAPGQKAYLYKRFATSASTWERDLGGKILGFDRGVTDPKTKKQMCGNRALKVAPPADPSAPPVAASPVEDEVCVYAEVSKSSFKDTCTALSKPSAAAPEWGMAQTGNGPEDKTIECNAQCYGGAP